jgi:hypothetical protein
VTGPGAREDGVADGRVRRPARPSPVVARRRRLLAVLAVVAVLGAGSAALLAGGDDGPPPVSRANDGTTPLDGAADGLEWSLRGTTLTVTITDDVAPELGRRLHAGTFTFGCFVEDAKALGPIASVGAVSRFPTGVEQRRVRLDGFLPRATGCFLEPVASGGDLAAVRFVPEREDAEEVITIK